MYQLMRRQNVNGELRYKGFAVAEYRDLMPWCSWLNELCEKENLPCRFFITEYDECSA